MRIKSSLYLLIAMCMVTLTSCEIVGGIFKAGMWTAFILVALVVGVILWLFSRRRR